MGIITRRFRRVIGLSSFLSAVIVMVAVLGGTAGSTTASNRKTTVPSVDLAFLKSRISQYEKVPIFTAPGPSFNAASLKGKTVFDIPVASDVPFVQTIDSQMKAVADKVGLRYVECPNEGSPSQWVACMGEALAEKVNLIILDAGPNPAVLQPQIAAAHAAGIPVISTNTPEPVQCIKNPAYESRRFGSIAICEAPGTIPAAVTAHVDGLVPAPFSPSAILEADYITYESSGHANVLIVQSPDLYDSQAIVDIIKGEFQKRCGSGCKTTVIGAPVADWSTKIPTEVATALTKNPKIDYVLPIFDSMSTYVESGLLTVGRTNTVTIGATFNGTPSILKMVSSGEVKMDAGQSLAWTAWASMDQAMRVLAGIKAVPDELIPLRLFTKSNVRDAGTPPSATAGYGTTFMTGYEKLWGLPTS